MGEQVSGGVTFSAAQRCSGVRLSPKSLFLGIVAFGLPIAVTTGWTLGGETAPPAAPAPGGEGSIGTAPVHGTSVPPVGDVWSPAPPRPVAVATRVPTERRRSGPAASPSPTDRDLPDPTMTVRPAPSATDAPREPTAVPTPEPTAAEPPAEQ